MSSPDARREPSHPIPPPAADRRHCRRCPIPQIQIAIAPAGGLAVTGLATGVDISCGGLGLALTSDFTPGTRLRLSFRLDETTSFHRVPATVLRQELGVGAVVFGGWSAADRRKLANRLA